MKAIITKIRIATPATLPTTPPAMTGGDAVEEFEVPFPAAVFLDALPPATPVPPAFPPAAPELVTV
jgi:hypothetical protein